MKTTVTAIEVHKYPKCENAKTLGGHVTFYPQCFSNDAKHILTVCYPDGRKDVFFVCDECAKNITESVIENGCGVGLQHITTIAELRL